MLRRFLRHGCIHTGPCIAFRSAPGRATGRRRAVARAESHAGEGRYLCRWNGRDATAGTKTHAAAVCPFVRGIPVADARRAGRKGGHLGARHPPCRTQEDMARLLRLSGRVWSEWAQTPPGAGFRLPLSGRRRGRIVRAVNIRHRPNERPLPTGGHIGTTAPLQVQKGLATAMVALGLTLPASSWSAGRTSPPPPGSLPNRRRVKEQSRIGRLSPATALERPCAGNGTSPASALIQICAASESSG